MKLNEEEISKKLTEDKCVMSLKKYLENNGWEVGDNFCLGQNHGKDIQAKKNEQTLVVEVKGARSGAKDPIRTHFDIGQIKTHFGKAIVTTLQGIYENPSHIHAIAHPEDTQIREAIEHLLPLLKKLGIKHFWVTADGHVSEE